MFIFPALSLHHVSYSTIIFLPHHLPKILLTVGTFWIILFSLGLENVFIGIIFVHAFRSGNIFLNMDLIFLAIWHGFYFSSDLTWIWFFKWFDMDLIFLTKMSRWRHSRSSVRIWRNFKDTFFIRFLLLLQFLESFSTYQQRVPLVRLNLGNRRRCGLLYL